MNILLATALAVIGYSACMIVRDPDTWLSYIHALPIIFFMFYVNCYEKDLYCWAASFELAAVFASGIIVLLWSHNVLFDRLMLGVNCFLIGGGLVFLGHNDYLLQWYTVQRIGIPFFAAMSGVGFLSMVFTRANFIGNEHAPAQPVKYASSVLFGATIIAFFWSLNADNTSIVWSVMVPFACVVSARAGLRTLFAIF